MGKHRRKMTFKEIVRAIVRFGNVRERVVL